VASFTPPSSCATAVSCSSARGDHHRPPAPVRVGHPTRRRRVRARNLCHGHETDLFVRPAILNRVMAKHLYGKQAAKGNLWGKRARFRGRRHRKWGRRPGCSDDLARSACQRPGATGWHALAVGWWEHGAGFPGRASRPAAGLGHRTLYLATRSAGRESPTWLRILSPGGAW
jgi:hypothetical protein